MSLEDVSGYISVVGQSINSTIIEAYRHTLAVDKPDRAQVVDVLVDMKRRIEGSFYVIEEDESKIVLGTRYCPFGDKVIGRKSMCMITYNVLGYVAAIQQYGRPVKVRNLFRSTKCAYGEHAQL